MKLLIKIIKFFISTRFSLKLLLRIDNVLYKLITISAIENNQGVHPKQKIINYEKWFIDQINENSVVLDIGSNLGQMAKKMSSKCKLVYGIEINKESINFSKKLETQNLKFIHGDATTFDYKKLEKVDYVTLSNVLEHIENRISFIKKLIDEISWNSKPKFLIRVPMIDREWISVYKKEIGVEWKLDNTHFTEYSLSQFKDEMIVNNLTLNNYSIKFGELFASCGRD